jgi:[ribosomal protein S5]-alanine N-acetyltransferase
MHGIHIPTLRSARLTLRALCADDHKHLLAMASDAEVTRHLYEGPSPSAGEVWQRMAFALGQWGLRGYGMMAIEDSDGFVGRLGIHHGRSRVYCHGILDRDVKPRLTVEARSV